MNDAPLMLGVSGLRGIVGSSLTPDVASRFAAAFGSHLFDRLGVQSKAGKSPTRRPLVVVGRDGRQGGEVVLNAAIAGLVSVGCDVSVADIVMTPTLGVLVDQLNADAGLMVTASHNPQDWNGIKPVLRAIGAKPGVPSAGAPDKAQADQVLTRFRENRMLWRKADLFGVVLSDSLKPETHEKSVLKQVPAADMKRIKAGKFTIALDTVGGSGRLWGPRFLAALGCKVEELYPSKDFPDGVFPHAPEPLAENLGALCRHVKKVGAHIGLAQDPDADRLAIVDERGQYIGEEYTLALAAVSLLQERESRAKATSGKGPPVTPVLVANLSTSRMLDDVATRYGARVLRTPVGEANVAEAMRRAVAEGHEVVLGGEGNGGVIWPSVTYIRDSLSAAALVLALMARTGKRVSELVSELPTYSIVKRKVGLPAKDQAGAGLERLARAFTNERLDRQDGLRIDVATKKAWLHVRPSNTEPIMRLIAEAPTRQIADTLLDQASRLIGV